MRQARETLGRYRWKERQQEQGQLNDIRDSTLLLTLLLTGHNVHKVQLTSQLTRHNVQRDHFAQDITATCGCVLVDHDFIRECPHMCAHILVCPRFVT